MIEGEIDSTKALKMLMDALFSNEELKNSSLMGLHTKKKVDPKPSLDSQKRALVESKLIDSHFPKCFIGPTCINL